MRHALVIVALLAIGAPAGAADGLVPLADFARKVAYQNAKISPNGDYLAVATPVGDQTPLAIIDLKRKKIAGGMGFQRGEHVVSWHWVGPERVVLSIARRQGSLDQPRWTGELFAVNADGSGKTYLYGSRAPTRGMRTRRVEPEYGGAYVLDPLPRDPKHALVAIVPPVEGARRELPRHVFLERLDVEDGTRQRLSVLPAYPPVGAVADASGGLRFAFGHTRDGELLLFAPADNALRWAEVEHPGGRPESVELHAATPDGSAVFLTTSDAAGRECLREYRAGKFHEVACAGSGTVGQPIMAFDRSKPVALVDDTAQLKFLDDRHPDARLLASLQKGFGGDRVSITSYTLDAGHAVVLVDSDRNPGDYYLVDRASHKARYLLSRREWIDPARMAPSGRIAYKARDGATIHGYLTSPRGADIRKAPLVLLPHGGPHGVRDWWAWDGWAQALASRGYAVLQVNFRGSGGYGRLHERAGYQKWGTLMQDDLTDAVRWAIAEGIADAGRVCIFGASWGGYAALMSPMREPDLYRCAIGFAGVYHLAEQIDDSDTSDTAMGRSYLERVLPTDAAALAEQSPVTHVARLKIPVLIAHGTNDKRVPFSQAKLLRKALEKHQKPYEWLEYSGEEHGFWVDANHEDFLTKALAFLDQHIGAGAAPAPATR